MYFGGISINVRHWILPQPLAQERNFVMMPLAEILPDIFLSGHRRAADLAAALSDEGMRLLEEAV